MGIQFWENLIYFYFLLEGLSQKGCLKASFKKLHPFIAHVYTNLYACLNSNVTHMFTHTFKKIITLVLYTYFPRSFSMFPIIIQGFFVVL